MEKRTVNAASPVAAWRAAGSASGGAGVAGDVLQTRLTKGTEGAHDGQGERRSAAVDQPCRRPVYWHTTPGNIINFKYPLI
jgi:hypothetical protein